MYWLNSEASLLPSVLFCDWNTKRDLGNLIKICTLRFNLYIETDQQMSYFANFPVNRSPPSSVADKYTTATPLVLWEGVAVSTPLPTNNAAYSVMIDRSKINKYETVTAPRLMGRRVSE